MLQDRLYLNLSFTLQVCKLRGGKRDLEDCSAARRVLHRNSSLMGVHHGFDQRESQPHTLLRAASVTTVKALPYMRKIPRTNTHSVILNCDNHRITQGL